MNIKAFSKALYSSWYFYSPDRILLDCGEGCSIFLKQEIFAIEKIFLSHGHMDHIAGLLPFLCLRQSTKGDTQKGIEIYYPEGDRSIEILKETVSQMLGKFIRYPLSWTAINPGDEIELKKGRVMRVYQADHSIENPLIFVIEEKRRSLKEELKGTSGKQLAKLSDNEKFDYRTAKILAYSGDSMPVDPEVYKEVHTLIHECTFLQLKDRKYPIHSEIQEVFDLAKSANVQNLILCHISPRYPNSKIRDLIEKTKTHGINYSWIIPGKVNEIE